MSDEEINQKVNTIVKEYLEQASPDEWHLYAACSNYDGNREHLRWLVDNPNLDEATARLIYWFLGAGYTRVQYPTVDDVESDYKKKEVQFYVDIEERVAAGFYKEASIWFDPYKNGLVSADDYKDLYGDSIIVRYEIPNEMFEPVGTEFIDIESGVEGYDEGLPNELLEKIMAIYD